VALGAEAIAHCSLMESFLHLEEITQHSVSHKNWLISLQSAYINRKYNNYMSQKT